MAEKKVDFRKKKWHKIDLYACEHCKFDVLNDRAAMAAHLYQAHGIVGKKKERVIAPAVEKRDGE